MSAGVPLGPLVRTVLFVLVLPFSIVATVPSLILSADPAPVPDGWAWLGLAPVAAGVGVLLVCFAGFVLEGRGTPGPWDPPRRLVTGILYAHVRNPMYVGVTTTLVGEAILFRSIALLIWAAVVFAAFHTFVVLYEEPTLRRLFGPTYDDYRRRVPRWIPR
ncbi:MAG TPA: isoprenylcysteine carboxylmethyltransferase family protein [Candidatus Limnocylindria bacterium]|nr:isoprenylcysteine carboxylmethyltransferase family protein [Candidatus Limnocylindria bacterium]